MMPAALPNVPIPKTVPGFPAQAPPRLSRHRPLPHIGSMLPINAAQPNQAFPNWSLPDLPNSNITVRQVRLIEYWYYEDFQLLNNPTQQQAVRQLELWMRSDFVSASRSPAPLYSSALTEVLHVIIVEM